MLTSTSRINDYILCSTILPQYYQLQLWKVEQSLNTYVKRWKGEDTMPLLVQIKSLLMYKNPEEIGLTYICLASESVGQTQIDQ